MTRFIFTDKERVQKETEENSQLKKFFAKTKKQLTDEIAKRLQLKKAEKILNKFK